VGRAFGPEVLQRVHATSPDTMRVLLVPRRIDAAEAARQALACAHQAVQVEDGAEHFVACVERLIAVRWLVRDPGLRRALGNSDRLPSPPRLFIALQRVIADPLATVEDAARIVAQDAGLATRVLRVANSALFRRGQPVVDLAAAAASLGMDVLSQIVLSFEVYSRHAPANVDMEALRRRALQCSRLASRVAVDGADARVASTAALLADCAAPLMPALDRAALRELPLPRLWSGLPEESLIAAYLLGLWGMPHSLIEAVAFHHDALRVARGEARLNAPGAVHVARALIDGAEPDARVIAQAGAAQRLETWRQAAQVLRDGAAQARSAA
jgi:HD-like signal output (HDOD) protein